MEGLIAVVIGLLTGCGVYLLLRARTFPVVLGLTLLSYGVNLFLFAMGRLTIGVPAILDRTVAPDAAAMADPLPQALVLTAIVIGFGMTAFVVVLALRARSDLGNDHVDGKNASCRSQEEQRVRTEIPIGSGSAGRVGSCATQESGLRQATALDAGQSHDIRRRQSHDTRRRTL
jgi:multicomponent K+:H+ antiporter subunit C